MWIYLTDRNFAYIKVMSNLSTNVRSTYKENLNMFCNLGLWIHDVM